MGVVIFKSTLHIDAGDVALISGTFLSFSFFFFCLFCGRIATVLKDHTPTKKEKNGKKERKSSHKERQFY